LAGTKVANPRIRTTACYFVRLGSAAVMWPTTSDAADCRQCAGDLRSTGPLTCLPTHPHHTLVKCGNRAKAAAASHSWQHAGRRHCSEASVYTLLIRTACLASRRAKHHRPQSMFALGSARKRAGYTCSCSAFATSDNLTPPVPAHLTTAAVVRSTSCRKRAMHRGSRRRSASATGAQSQLPSAAASCWRAVSSPTAKAAARAAPRRPPLTPSRPGWPPQPATPEAFTQRAGGGLAEGAVKGSISDVV